MVDWNVIFELVNAHAEIPFRVVPVIDVYLVISIIHDVCGVIVMLLALWILSVIRIQEHAFAKSMSMDHVVIVVSMEPLH